MKKYIYCAFIALITLACNQDDEPLSKKTSIGAPDTFYAQTPVYKSRALTKIQYESWEESEKINSRTYAVKDESAGPNEEMKTQGEYLQYWEENDAISVFYTTANSEYKLKSYKNNSKDYGVFETDKPIIEGQEFSTGYYYSVYPYKESTIAEADGTITYNFPEIQHYNQHVDGTLNLKGDSYSNGENAMVAIEPKEGTDYTLYFKNFCSYLQLSLIDKDGICQTFIDEDGEKKPKKVTSIKLVANNPADKLTGTATVTLLENDKKEEDNTHTPEVDMSWYNDVTNKITLDCGDGITLSTEKENPTQFWFVLPGGFTFTQGFIITVIFNDGSYYRKGTTKPIEIERSHIRPMAPVNPDPSLPIGPIVYKYNSKETNTETKSEPFPVKSTFYDKDGYLLEVMGQRYYPQYDEWMILLSGTLKSIGSKSFQHNISGVDIEYIKVDNAMKFGREDNAYNTTENTIKSSRESNEGGNTIQSININSNAFYDCSADYIEIFNDVEKIYSNGFDMSTTTDLFIHGNVNTFATNAGHGSKIINVLVDKNVQNIEYQAFNECDYLSNITIAKNLESITDVHIGNQAFKGCNQLVTVDIQGAKTIGSQAFDGCNSLETVTITNVNTIEYGTFNGCTNLKTIDLQKVKNIRDNAFYNCTNLENVDLKSIEEIGWNAFTATALKTIKLPDCCTKIGEGAFKKCSNLQTVYCNAKTPPYIDSDNGTEAEPDSDLFAQTAEGLIIYVPSALLDSYKNPRYFKPYKNWWYNYYEKGIIVGI